MKDLTIFIIYHKTAYESNTSTFTQQEIKDYFTWVSVNESIKKEDSWIPKEQLLEECKMAKYSPLLQMTNFYQNSVFFHLYWNKQLITSKYIGFAQYDMTLPGPEIRSLAASLKGDTADKIIPVYPYPFEALYDHLKADSWNECFIKPYNAFYGTSHSIESLKSLPIFLIHTYIMPKWFFIHMMEFVDHNLPVILKALKWDTRHLAGALERVLALCITCGIAEGKFRHLIHLQGVSHNSLQHTGDALRGLNPGLTK